MGNYSRAGTALSTAYPTNIGILHHRHRSSRHVPSSPTT